MTSLNFIQAAVETDLNDNRYHGRVQTRFPPEPNGYLHIGHAKAICLDFGIAHQYGGICMLRLDDTNPSREDTEFVDAIINDISWLGFHVEHVVYASDYFPQLFDFACRLIKQGLAYVDPQPSELIALQKGSPTQPGTPSPFRERPADESLDLFIRMNNGEFDEGAMTLRAKIDMASPNMHFRDPVIYRIIKAPHHRTGSTWNVYPMYDFAHGQSDFFEGVTHSLCTLEFEVHRPLYDYFVELLRSDDYRPRQIEFNRLNLSFTLMSKRKLLQLVQQGVVNGWDDPRMPTLCGLRRRGYTPNAIRSFIDKIGYTKYDGIVDIALLEHALRDDLNRSAPRVSAVLNPIKLTITNFPEDRTEFFDAPINPEDPAAGSNQLPFSRHLIIERDDFLIDPPKHFYRLAPDREVRLHAAYIIRCTGFDTNPDGSPSHIYATYDPDTKSGSPLSNRKVKATLHWLSEPHSLPAEVRLYDRLFLDEVPSDLSILNPNSLISLTHARVEPSLAHAAHLDHFQFRRIGYFNLDPDSSTDHLIFNRTTPLKDPYAKLSSKA